MNLPRIRISTYRSAIRGGGSVSNVRLASNEPPLRWMSYEAIEAGIRMTIPEARWTKNPCEQVHESMKWYWKPLEYIPIVPKHKRQRKGIWRRWMF